MFYSLKRETIIKRTKPPTTTPTATAIERSIKVVNASVLNMNVYYFTVGTNAAVVHYSQLISKALPSNINVRTAYAIKARQNRLVKNPNFIPTTTNKTQEERIGTKKQATADNSPPKLYATKMVHT